MTAIIWRPIRCIKFLQTRCFSKIVITDDGSTLVALHHHQARDFPYELSRPLPEPKPEDPSVLRMSDYDEVKRVFKDVKPDLARQQLANMTLTTTHRWFPRARDKKAKKTPMDRPFL